MAIIYLAVIVTITFFFLYQFPGNPKKDNVNFNKNEAPEPPGHWPIIGHLPMLAGATPAHQVMASLADKYGPAITLRLGRQRALLISNWELAKECFTANDRALSGRPRSTAGRHLGFDFACFALATYSPYCRDARKIVIHEFLSVSKLDSIQTVWASEVDKWVRELYGLFVENGNKPVVVEMKDRFWRLSTNVITTMAAGKRLFESHGDESEEAAEFRRVAGQLLYLLTVPNVDGFLPFLRWLDLQGYEKASMRTAREMDSIMQRWLEEHCMKMENGEGNDGCRDFLSTLLSMRKDGQLPHHYPTDTFIKATIFILIIAGAETTSIELAWALSLLMNHRHVLRKAQDELDAMVGPDRAVHPSDIEKLPYIRAIVKETLRLYPVGPLLVPHEATEDCKVGGFHVRAGTHLMVNVWKIHRDPRVWSNPLEFCPERFLDRHVDVNVWGQHFELIPFGSGRRSCVGSYLAVQVMQLALARLLHGFDWATPLDGPADMSEGFAFSLLKLKPLELIITPRLPPAIYN